MNKKEKKRSIRSRILISLLTLIGCIFLGIICSFNLLVTKYIEKSSYKKLETIKKTAHDIEKGPILEKPHNNQEKNENKGEYKETAHFIKNIKEKIIKEKWQSDIQMMIISENYNMTFPKEDSEVLEDINNYKNIVKELQN